MPTPTYMRKSGKTFDTSKLLITIAVIILLALGAFFYWKINVQEKRINDVQKEMADNNSTLSAIVNYINSVVASQQQQ